MVVLGAGGHAKEILEILRSSNQLMKLAFYDDSSIEVPHLLYDTFPIIRTKKELLEYFIENGTSVILGTGSPKSRYSLSEKAKSLNADIFSIVSVDAYIGSYDVFLGRGINIMYGAWISNSVSIGNGTLINAFTKVHHDVNIGDFCEISPSSNLLGACSVGSFVTIGANSTVLPKIKIGSNTIIGAGSVVTKDIPEGVVAYGNPAKIIKNL
jgi:sugar O-acyltransferase (sialic acid O-acetyltransferase NeuD family)